MSFDFADATPIKRTVNRTSESNPFQDVVNAINGKTAKVDGKDVPVAKAYTMPYNADKDSTEYKAFQKALRQLGSAGDNADTKCTVKKPYTIAADSKSVTITFWTVTRQTKTPAAPKAADKPTTK